MSKKQRADSSFLNGMTEISPGVFQKTKTTLQPREIAIAKAKKVSHQVLLQEIVPQISPEGSLVFRWEGKDISLNKWYSSEHWTKRNDAKQDWHNFFKQFVPKPYPFFPIYTITLEANSRIDLSNLITLIKLSEDTMKELGVIVDDSCRYCKKITIIHNEKMKRKSYCLTFSQE